MKEAFEQAETYEKRDVDAALKAEAWQRFTSTFDQDNPFSEEDDALRAQAAEHLAHWQRKAARIASEPSPPPSLGPSPVPPEGGDEWTEPVLGMRFHYVPAGTFQMGSPEKEQGRFENEKLHTVKLSRSYWMGETEVSQGQWRQLMEKNPSGFQDCGDECPVENVTWWEAVTFANRLSGRSGLENCYVLDCQGTPGEGDYSCKSAGLQEECQGFRLPTEAEWERAARAGTEAATYAGDLKILNDCNAPNLNNIAWYCGNSSRKTHPVGRKQSNNWGLQDMLGNVWEWVEDTMNRYDDGKVADPLNKGGSYRVFRGGSWIGGTRTCRSACRNGASVGSRDLYIGFRLVRTAH